MHALRARQEALETANETLHEAFRAVDGDAHTALEVARQNVKLMTALRTTQLEHGEAIGGIASEVVALKDDVGRLKDDVGTLKGELRDELGTMQGDVGEIKAGLAEVLRRLPE
jgi:hypothetical protein